MIPASIIALCLTLSFHQSVASQGAPIEQEQTRRPESEKPTGKMEKTPQVFSGSFRIEISGPEQQPTANISEKQTSEKESWFTKLRTEPQSGAAVAIAILTVVLILVGAIQATRLRQTVEAQHQAIEQLMEREQRELRAYVSINKVGIENVIGRPPQIVQPPPPNVPQPSPPQFHAFRVDPSRGPRANVIIKNTGKTPAYRVEVVVAMIFSKIGDPLPPLPEGGAKPKSVLGPGMSAVLTRDMMVPLTEMEDAALADATGTIFMYGWITYVDAYQCQRRTDFRMKYSSSGLPLGQNHLLNFCEEGNDAS